MGRTVPTFNTTLQYEIDSWRPFRRALRAEHKAAFDRLFSRAREFTAESTSAARATPFDAIVLGILLSQELEVERLAARVAELEADRGGIGPGAGE